MTCDLCLRVAAFVAAGHSRRAARPPGRACGYAPPMRTVIASMRNGASSATPTTAGAPSRGNQGRKFRGSGREPTRRIERRLSAAEEHKARHPCSRAD